MILLHHSSQLCHSAVCLDDSHGGDDDYQEVNAVPPQSVLDVYRQPASLGDSGSQGPNVIARLTA